MLEVSETSALHSPKPYTALVQFTFSPATVPRAPTPLLLDSTNKPSDFAALERWLNIVSTWDDAAKGSCSCTPESRRPIARPSIQPTQRAEALFPPCSRRELGLGIGLETAAARKRNRCASIVNNKNKEVSTVHSPGRNAGSLFLPYNGPQT